MKRFLVLPLLVLLFLTSCSQKSKESLMAEGLGELEKNNLRGAIILFKKATEKDPNFFEARYHLGKAYLDTGRLDQAEKEFLKVNKQHGGYEDVEVHLARIFVGTERPDKAIEFATKYLKSHADSPRPHELIGEAYFKKGDYGQAESSYRKAMEKDPEGVKGKLLLAKLLSKLERFDEVESLLNGVLEKDPKEIVASLLLADVARQKGDLTRALEVYEEALRFDQKTPFVAYMAGILYFAKSDREGLVAKSKYLSEKFPERPETNTLQGMVHYLDDEFKKAGVAFQLAEAAYPTFPSVYFLGMSQYRMGNYEIALNKFQKCLDLKPDALQPRIMTAMTLLYQKRAEDAVAAAEKVLKVDSENPIAYNILGSANMLLGDYDQAMAFFEKATELDPNLVTAHLQKGVYNLSRGDKGEGEAQLLRAVEIAPEILNTRLILAAHQIRQQNNSAAIETLKEGLTGAPEDAIVYNYMAGAQFAMRKVDEAIESLKKAKAVNPEYFTPYINLAGYYSSLGEHEKALVELEEILQLNPNHFRATLAAGVTADVLGDEDKATGYFIKARESESPLSYRPLIEYYVRRGKKAEALAVLDEEIGDDPTAVAPLEIKARLLLEWKEYEKATELFRKLEVLAPGRGVFLHVSSKIEQDDFESAVAISKSMVKEKPLDTIGYQLLARSYSEKGEYGNALKALDSLPVSLAENNRLIMLRGDIYMKSGDADKAIGEYNRVVAAAPESVAGYYALASTYDHAGDKRKAVDTYTKALSISPGFVPVLNNLAFLYADNYGNTEEALSLAVKAYTKEPANPAVMDTMGFILVKTGRFEDALKLLSKAKLALHPNPTVNYHLALAYEGLGKKEEQAAELEEALRMGEFPERERCEAMLAKLGK